MIFSDKLQLIRKNKGLTQEELAEKLSVSRQAVAKWESGQVYPDISNLIQISNIFSVTIDYLVMLMYGKEASNRKQEIDRQHHTIPNQRNQRPKDKHRGNVYNLLFRHGKVRSQNMEKLKGSFPTFCKQTFPQFHKIASYAHYAQCRLQLNPSHSYHFSGKRFEDNFPDFIKKYGFKDMYSAGFYPYKTLEEHWAYWSRYVFINRYENAPKSVYNDLYNLIRDKDYFVLTTNVDHCFQKAGFDKHRLFYTQGDYGLWQCSKPCHNKTYDNEAIIKKMVAKQENMLVPSELVPHCPVCGAPMSMNLRADNTFVEDDGWHIAAERYQTFIRRHRDLNIVYLELGVGGNTPGIIKYPFWQMTYNNPNAAYICINLLEAYIPAEIREQSISITGDIGETLNHILPKGKYRTIK